ncbi:hypothetical protein LOY88_006877, partial [Ophidiomyces ophidiicola]
MPSSPAPAPLPVPVPVPLALSLSPPSPPSSSSALSFTARLRRLSQLHARPRLARAVGLALSPHAPVFDPAAAADPFALDPRASTAPTNTNPNPNTAAAAAAAATASRARCSS